MDLILKKLTIQRVMGLGKHIYLQAKSGLAGNCALAKFLAAIAKHISQYPFEISYGS